METFTEEDVVLSALEFETRCLVGIQYRQRASKQLVSSEGPCEKPARWTAKCRGCGQVLVLCSDHRFMPVSEGVACAVCEQTGESLDAVFVVVPL